MIVSATARFGRMTLAIGLMSIWGLSTALAAADLSPAEIQAAEDDLKQAIKLIKEQK